jgi:hypothetical protein
MAKVWMITAAYNLAAAAQATGLSKSTIFEAITCDKIPGTESDRGKWHREPQSFHRICPARELSNSSDAAPQFDQLT